MCIYFSRSVHAGSSQCLWISWVMATVTITWTWPREAGKRNAGIEKRVWQYNENMTNMLILNLNEKNIYNWELKQIWMIDQVNSNLKFLKQGENYMKYRWACHMPKGFCQSCKQVILDLVSLANCSPPPQLQHQFLCVHLLLSLLLPSRRASLRFTAAKHSTPLSKALRPFLTHAVPVGSRTALSLSRPPATFWIAAAPQYIHENK